MFNLYYIQNASWEWEVTVELFWSGFGFCGNSDFFSDWRIHGESLLRILCSVVLLWEVG